MQSALAAASMILSKCGYSAVRGAGTAAQDFTPTASAYLPLVNRGAPPTPTNTPEPPPTPVDTPVPGVSRVVHIRNPNATNWSGSGWYGSAVDQSVVTSMVQAGMLALTGESSWTGVWGNLFSRVQPSGYAVGQKIAIKVNLNNSSSNGGCTASGNYIDALPQPVYGLLAGLTTAGVAEDDIWIYDATKLDGRLIPYRFYDPIHSSFAGVHFYGNDDCDWTVGCSHGGSPDLTVSFSDPRLTDRQLTDLLHDVTYLINMPILKRHGISPVTLGFKNHLGSVDNIIRAGSDNIHAFIDPDENEYSQSYSPLVDIYANPNIKDKTVLIAGDGLFGAAGAASPASQSWSDFGNDAPNSLFFAIDPVAIDCLMADLIESEFGNKAETHDYLFCAEEVGLGVCEGTRASPGGDPWQLPYGSGYSKIEYVRTDL